MLGACPLAVSLPHQGASLQSSSQDCDRHALTFSGLQRTADRVQRRSNSPGGCATCFPFAAFRDTTQGWMASQAAHFIPPA